MAPKLGAAAFVARATAARPRPSKRRAARRVANDGVQDLPNGSTIHLTASLGGHLELLDRLSACFSEYDRVWVTAAGRGADRLRDRDEQVRDLPRLNRSRALSPAINILGSLAIVLRERPKVIVSAGAGSVVAFTVFGRLLGAKVIFIETMARVTSPSLSGRVLSKVASAVLVQWPELKAVYPRAIVCRPALWEDVWQDGEVRSPAVDGARPRAGTFVAVGTHRHPFDRLLSIVDHAVGAGRLPGPITAQTGVSAYEPENFTALPWLSAERLAIAMQEAEYVVCHAGSGIIAAALRTGHKPMVLARRALWSEHVDDHQQQLVDKLSSLGLIVPLDKEIGEAELAASRTEVREPRSLADGSSVMDTLAEHLALMLEPQR